MKRLVRDGRVVYVRRHFGLSLLFISLSLSIVLYAWRFPSPDKGELGVALYYGVPLALAGMVATIRAQVFAIDRSEGKLMVLHRQLFRTHRDIFDLSTISVLLKSVHRGENDGRPHHWIWIELPTRRSSLFCMRKGDVPRAEAELLAADLGCPLKVEGS